CPRTGATSIYSRPPAVGSGLEYSVNGHRAEVEEVGVLLHSAHDLRHRDLVPVLLDARDRDPPRRRALSLVARREQPAVLDAPADTRARRRPDGENDVSALAVELVLHRGDLHGDLARVRAPGGLRAGPAPVPDGRRARHLDLRDLSRAADLAVHPARGHHP